MNLQDQLKQIQQNLADEKAKGAQRDQAKIADLEKQEAAMLEKIMIEQKSQQVQQDQQKMQDSITLPDDYDTKWKVPGANALMIDFIKQTQDQVFAYMNIQMADAASSYQSKIVDAQQTAQKQIEELQKQIQDQTDLQNKFNELQTENETISTQLVDAKSQLSQLQLDKKDAESKRDAAVKEADAMKSQINELEALNRTLKMDKSSGFQVHLVSTSQHESKILSAAEVAMKRAGIEPLPVNQFRQQDPPTNAAGNTPVLPTSPPEVTFPVSVADPEPSGEVEAKEVTRAEFAALEARVKALEAK